MSDEGLMLLLILIPAVICLLFGVGGLLWCGFRGSRCPKCGSGRLKRCQRSYFRKPNPPLGYWTDVREVCSSSGCRYEKFIGTFAGGG